MVHDQELGQLGVVGKAGCQPFHLAIFPEPADFAGLGVVEHDHVQPVQNMIVVDRLRRFLVQLGKGRGKTLTLVVVAQGVEDRHLKPGIRGDACEGAIGCFVPVVGQVARNQDEHGRRLHALHLCKTATQVCAGVTE